MEIMLHLRQKDVALDVIRYAGLSLLLADAMDFYEERGFVTYSGMALNPTMDTFVLVNAMSVSDVDRLIDQIERVPAVRQFLGDSMGIRDLVDVRIMPMRKPKGTVRTKGFDSLTEGCRRLQEVVDSPIVDEGTRNDAQEEFDRLHCEDVLGGGGGGGGGDGGPIDTGGPWPEPPPSPA